MTDRELLELAAKAAGMVNYNPDTGSMIWRDKDISEPDASRWNARNAGKQVTVKTVVVNTCNRLRCVNPDHLSAVSHSAKTKLAWNRGLVNETVFRANHARSAQSRSKLSWDEVRAIRARNANGESMASLAREYGVWVSAISSICNHQRWVDAGPFAQLVGRA
jgi:hypothetical protein